MEEYSVLMSTYYKDNPVFVQKAINSMKEQSIPFFDFVIVCDGPLMDELNNVLYHESVSDPRIKILRLDQNQGLGPALNFGLKSCKCDLIARMDSDDISLPDRCQKQIQAFDSNPELSLCSGYVTEFELDPNSPGSTRKVPKSHPEIYEFSKSRNPFNHPCMMYRKSAVQNVGGYQNDFPFFEDYDLWLRMLWNGSKASNIPETILMMRAGESMYKRRSGLKQFHSMLKLFKNMLKHRHITFREYMKSIIIRTIGFIIPTNMRKFFYQKSLRN